MRKVTMLDVAQMAGVSKATVSMVLNKKDASISEETRTKILNIAKEVNYIPNSIARSLSTKKSGTIGIIVPDITNPFFSEIARAIEDGAGDLGYNVIFCNTDNEVKKEQKYIELLISKLVDGVIFIAGGRSSGSIKILKNNNVPFVLVDRYIEEDEALYGVYCNNKQGIIDGLNYLYNKGKRKIAYVDGPSELGISKERREAYKTTLTEYGIFNKKLIFKGDFTIEGGMKATEEILASSEQIDAIFFSNDIMALGGMKILLRQGYKIPDEVSIIGYDNVQISAFVEPELTTISQPIYEMGRQACKLLIGIINGAEETEKQIYFKPKLIIRGTT